MNRSTPGLPVPHQLPEFTQAHVHRVSDAIQPSHPLSSPLSCWQKGEKDITHLKNFNPPAKYSAVIPLHLHISYQQTQPTSDQKNSEKRISESSEKQNLNLPPAGNNSHSIYIALDVTNNLEMI